MIDLNNKRIIITGASKGIGKALALEIVKHKCRIVLLSRDTEKLLEVKSAIIDNGGTSECFFCDVSKKESITEAFDKALKFLGGIDVAILNSGIGVKDEIQDFKADATKNVFDVNFFGILNSIEYLFPLMKGNGGTIACVSSLADSRGYPNSGAYCAGKSALSSYLESIRPGFGKLGLNIVTVKPGFVRTDMVANNDYFMPFIMTVERAAKIIVDGLEKGKKRIYFPWQTVFLSYIMRVLPDSLFDLLSERTLKLIRKKK